MILFRRTDADRWSRTRFPSAVVARLKDMARDQRRRDAWGQVVREIGPDVDRVTVPTPCGQPMCYLQRDADGTRLMVSMRIDVPASTIQACEHILRAS